LVLKPNHPYQLERTQYLELRSIILNVGFVFEDAEDMRASFAEERQNMYSRYSNKTNRFVKVCKMEGATAGFAFAGMAAVYSTMAALLKSGDHIVSSSSVFRTTFVVCQLFSEMEYSNIVFFDNPSQILKVFTPDTRFFLLNHNDPAVDRFRFEGILRTI
jgi:O-succinylhomoserine sulfhydrylase